MEASVIDPFASVSAALADARRLDDQDLCDAIHDAEMALRRHQAHTAVLTAELNSRIQAMGYPLNGAAEELATMLAISPRSADHRMDTAVGLCDRELLWAALYDGRIDQAKAVMIHDLLAAIPDPRREELELIAVGYAQSHTGHQLRKKLLAPDLPGPRRHPAPPSHRPARSVDNTGRARHGRHQRPPIGRTRRNLHGSPRETGRRRRLRRPLRPRR
jgi:hypothetical protein